MARLPDADEDQLPLPRLDPRGPHCARLGAPARPGAALGSLEHAGVAELLLQESDDVPGRPAGARSVHAAHEPEERATRAHGGGFEPARRAGVLSARNGGLMAELSPLRGARTPLRGAIVGFGFIAENGHVPAYRARRES